MRKSKGIIVSLFLAAALFMPGTDFTAGQENRGDSMTALYKKGTIAFTPELVINNDFFPEHVDAVYLADFRVGGECVYIADILLCEIKILKISGEYIGSFGHKGTGPGDVYLPHHMAFTGGNLIVSESGNRRFSVFDSGGKFIRHVKPRYRGMVTGIESLDDGSIIVAREVFGWGKKEYESYFGLELFSKDFEYIKDIYQQKIEKYITVKNERRSLIKPFPQDYSWGVLPGNKIVIGFSGGYNLEIHDLLTWKTQSFKHAYVPEKVTGADKKSFFDNIENVTNGKLTKGADKFTRDHTNFPEFKPAFREIITDSEGNILVFLFKDSRDGKLKYFDVFDSRGDFINQVKIVSNGGINFIKLAPAKGDTFWSLEEYEPMEPAIIKYKVR